MKSIELDSKLTLKVKSNFVNCVNNEQKKYCIKYTLSIWVFHFVKKYGNFLIKLFVYWRNIKFYLKII